MENDKPLDPSVPIKTDGITCYKSLFYIILIVLTILLLYVIYITVNPTVPIKYIKNKFHIAGDVEIEQDATSIRLFTATVELPNTPPTTFSHNIYYSTKDTNQKNKLIIDLPGGAFINSSNTLKPYIHAPDLDIDVVSIEYPTLPKGTAFKVINFIEQAIQSIIDEYKTKWNTELFEIYISTASAGSYYGVKIINNNKFINYIKKFTAVSGYFGYKTIDNLITAIGDKVYLRKLQTTSILDCKPLQDGIIETFYAVADNDILKTSTLTFLRLTNQDLNARTYYGTGHCFYTHYNSLDTQKYYKDYVDFIKN
ncbi:Esterase [Dikerogammarus haemobaphes nudivirus]|nr:Esterase [Dikerogammarus haemobaphes nudivirus]